MLVSMLGVQARSAWDQKHKLVARRSGWGRRDGRGSLVLAPGVEHGVLGGPEAQEVPHLIAELGEVLSQVVEVLHGGLVGALHLLSRGRQVSVDQTAHDLLVVLISLLLQALPLLVG